MVEVNSLPIKTTKTYKQDRICFYIILFDILFMPLFPLVSVSMSLPVLAYWYLTQGNKTHFVNEYSLMRFVVLIMAFSTLLNLLDWGALRGETSFATSIKRFFQFLTSLWYFLFFKYYFIKYNDDIKKYFLWEVAYIAFFALLYLLFQDQFVHYKSIINPADPHTKRYLAGELYGIYRYTYFWADANNVGYAISGIALFYILEQKDNLLLKYLAVVLTFFILFCTMSIGGIGVGVVVIGYSFIFTNAFKNKNSGIIVLLLFIIAIAYFVSRYGGVIEEFINTGVESRVEKYSESGNATGGRLADIKTAFSLMSPFFLFFGSGHEGYTTENGHLYLICLYGLPVYLYFMYVLFGKRKGITWKRYLPLIPFFVGFTMNIAIIDQKFLLILILISAYYSAESYRRKQIKRDIVEIGINNNS